MKRQVFCVLACLLCAVLLCACALPEPPVQTMPIPQTPAQTPSEAPTEAPTEPPETEFIPAVPPTFLTNPIDPDDPDSAPFLQSFNGGAVETELGLFCRNAHLLYHAEPGSPELRPFCNIPGCRHESEDCEAWLTINANPYSVWTSVGFCDGMLWLTDSDPDDPRRDLLIRMDPSTKKREFVREIPLPEYSREPEWLDREYRIHKGKLFACVHAGDNLPLEERQYHYYVMDLRTGEVAEPFTALFEQHVQEEFVFPYLFAGVGDQLYSVVSFYHEETVDGLKLAVREPWITRLDPQTGAWERLLRTDGKGGAWYVEQDTVYASEWDGVFLEYDMTSGELRRFETGLEAFARAYDDEHVYCYDYEITRLYVLSRAYELQGEIELPENHQFLGSVKKTAYVNGGDSATSSEYVIDYKLDVAEAGEGELTLQPLEWRKPS